MDLQTLFYTLGIVYMVLGILLLLGIAIGMIYVVRKITELQKIISEKMSRLSEIADHPGDIAVDVGSALVSSAIKKVKKIAQDKNKD